MLFHLKNSDLICYQLQSIKKLDYWDGFMTKILFVTVIAALFFTGCSSTPHKESAPMQKTTTPSGLQFQILNEAPDQAKKPKAGQVVVVHYTGWLDEQGTPGKKFDSSVDRSSPFSFVVGKGQVIKGWDESLLDMKVGEKRRVHIPPTLGYGSRGAGAVIPPNATLIFDIELIEIAK